MQRPNNETIVDSKIITEFLCEQAEFYDNDFEIDVVIA